MCKSRKVVLLSVQDRSSVSLNGRLDIYGSCNGGILWRRLEEVDGRMFRKPSQMTISIPEELACKILRFRFVSSDQGGWALDDLVYEPFRIEETRETTDGIAGSWCGREGVITFRGENRTGFLEYGPTQVGANYIVSFDLVIGCGSGEQGEVLLEYSVDQGITWHLLFEDCNDDACFGVLWNGSVFHSSHFSAWRRVILHMPSAARGRYTKLRWSERTEEKNSSAWAINHVYVGPDCPSSCSGHGSCTSTGCMCDAGFSGGDCSNAVNRTEELVETFDSENLRVSVRGGSTTDDESELVFSGRAAKLNETVLREVETEDVALKGVEFVDFFLRWDCTEAVEDTNVLLLLMSKDGGLSWIQLQTLAAKEFCSTRFVRLPIPTDFGSIARFKWWQDPFISAAPWFLDQIALRKQEVKEDGLKLGNIIDFNSTSWIARTTCSYVEGEDATMFVGVEKIAVGILDNVVLTEEAVFQFEINVDSKTSSSKRGTVFLEFSLDNAISWSLLQDHCYPSSSKTCGEDFSEVSVYGSTEGRWNRYTIFPRSVFHNRRLLLRWRQSRDKGDETFALKNIYFGLPCPNLCSGQGVCTPQMECLCDEGFSGSSCEISVVASPSSILEDFEDISSPHRFRRITGYRYATELSEEYKNSYLNFSLDGPRTLITEALDFTSSRMIRFELRTASALRLAEDESVILDISNSNGQSWLTMELIHEPGTVVVEIPLEMKVPRVLLRVWQPYSEGKKMPWWTLDNLELVPNVLSTDFRSNVSNLRETWSEIHGGLVSEDAIKFGGVNEDSLETYATTKDFEVTKNSFLQFSLMIEESVTRICSVRLDVSKDMGQSWILLRNACLPEDTFCTNYETESIFEAVGFALWRRVTVPVLKTPGSSKMRLRFSGSSPSCLWMLKDVALSHRCPWMCSGKGYCVDGVCKCDTGYVGPYCVASPELQLADELYESFDSQSSVSSFQVVKGGRIGRNCGTIGSGSSLNFEKAGQRLLETFDFDLSSAESLQFTVKFGCAETNSSTVLSRNDGLLVQYSPNGGAQWFTLKEIRNTPGRAEVVIPLASNQQLKTNSTRFRFWQPSKPEKDNRIWSIDNLVLSSRTIRSQPAMEDFENKVNRTVLLYHTGGKVGSYCNGNQSEKMLVFVSRNGDRLAVTRDVYVEDDTVVQFKIKVGCGSTFYAHYPVRFEYSTDHGKSWRLVSDFEDMPSIYYSNQARLWERHVIRLSDMGISGVVRFRWVQHIPAESVVSVSWALDNLYIGYSCQDDCSGHGSCSLRAECVCDEGYEGNNCENVTKPLPSHFQELFESLELDREFISGVSGASASSSCNLLETGSSLVFSGPATRMLTTGPLDLTTASFSSTLAANLMTPMRT